MSPLVTDIIKQILIGHLRLDVVLEVNTRDFLEHRLQISAPDLVLVGLRASETDAVALSVLALLPAAKVIAFSGDARQAYVHEMRPHRAVLIDISRQALIDAIRGPSPTSPS